MSERTGVLESSPGLEVLELGSPAEHYTFQDLDLELPTPELRPQRARGLFNRRATRP